MGASVYAENPTEKLAGEVASASGVGLSSVTEVLNTLASLGYVVTLVKAATPAAEPVAPPPVQLVNA